MKIKGVVFDMDGVLFDTEAVSKKTWFELASEWHLPGMEQVYPKAVGRNKADNVRMLKESYGKDFDTDAFFRITRERMLVYLHRYGIPFKKGARQIVSFLKERNVPVAICSSTGIDLIMDHLKQAGWEHTFDAVVGGNMVPHSKPKPDIYVKACEKLSLSPQECLGAEDSPNGLNACHAAGLFTVMIPDMIQPAPQITAVCDRVFESLTELQDFLEKTLETEA